ncbi:histidine kinase [Intrasporangium chromatireducens Q5-1]|uniref:Histidine kinase n=1 Tax=Intrasporangium chromatireducens Q5-1 TaxID=584657 RepID=W9GTR4_9MICO|nr:CBS domain-containing protein [Intrasporangium chromatireducens]EWT07279.1 histidine kinase [Intrasporangium chromatireducens Q5-1]
MPTARDLMTSPAHCLNEGDTLVAAAQALRSSGVGSMPIKDSTGALAGMLTDRDIVVRGIAEGFDPTTSTVGEISTQTVVVVSVDDDEQAVLNAFAQNQVRRLPVVDGQDVVGVISQADIARSLPTQDTGGLVQAISQETGERADGPQA